MKLRMTAILNARFQNKMALVLNIELVRVDF